MIVITPHNCIENESNYIHALFEEGLDLLHVRKPDFTETEMRTYINGIQPKFHHKIVLHQFHHLAEEFYFDRIHLSNPNQSLPNRPIDRKSTSSHSIEAFNLLGSDYDYAFLSPVYPSISKIGYRSKINLTETVKQRTNFKTKLVALGGIDTDNIQQTLKNGFDDVALLGTIWLSANPLETFKKCQQIVHSF
ncbi:thiamine phosphate synthase [Flavobacterium sp. SM15]|uniref:thiamine phosphate synthase n=1 Tax=Flavobacterium sp. SM15 TaxID=2908005 RepID=UPI001EDC9088|nr:thiamine phosphate synthase [Flavobacterium sp. SM15]MCG2610875.1 thiamine phosphate synthase [Flavobacterium sp. SM15]